MKQSKNEEMIQDQNLNSTTEISVQSTDDIAALLEASTGLEKKKPSLSLTQKYFEFAKVGEKTRGIFFGLTTINVKDKESEDLREIKAVQWISDKQVYINGGANLVSQVEKLNLPKGTAIEVEFTEKSGNVKIYSISLLA